ncbi:transposase [Streptomyces sp. ME02-6991-2A]|uniref:transposase n=1 Tax=Streptomyces sp. ME02-6991-2A TaxID=3028677 RepID=UPI0039F6BEBB
MLPLYSRPAGSSASSSSPGTLLSTSWAVATSGCTWRQLPPLFGPAWPTAYRRFAPWSRDRFWARAPPRDPQRTRSAGRAGPVAVRDRLGQSGGGKRCLYGFRQAVAGVDGW